MDVPALSFPMCLSCSLPPRPRSSRAFAS
jgi:hypothetical protein